MRGAVLNSNLCSSVEMLVLEMVVFMALVEAGSANLADIGGGFVIVGKPSVLILVVPGLSSLQAGALVTVPHSLSFSL